MDIETNKERVLAMLLQTCGCTNREAILVLEECLKKLEVRDGKESKRIENV